MYFCIGVFDAVGCALGWEVQPAKIAAMLHLNPEALGPHLTWRNSRELGSRHRHSPNAVIVCQLQMLLQTPCRVCFCWRPSDNGTDCLMKTEALF